MAFGQKLSLDDRRKKILDIIDEELSEVSRLNRQQDNKSPDTLLRVSELNLEKARLWREAENEQFLSIPPEDRRRVKKADYFKKSNNYFEAANSAGLVIVNKFKNYKGIGEVFYILAYNYKELGDNSNAQKYFKLASGKSSGNSKVAQRSNLALADYNFNAHKYAAAIPLYEKSLNKAEEKWWTKDAFNLAWSYYRVKNFDKAINLMKEVHRKSADGKFVDMRSLVERDIGIFFVDSGRVPEAVRFYEGLGINYTDQFVKIASAIIGQGRFAQAESLLNQAAKLEKNQDKRIEIFMGQLELFDKYDKVSEHLKVCRELVAMNAKSPLKEDVLKRLTYHVNKKAAELQKKTASNLYESVPKVRRQKAEESIAYFELSSQLSPGQKAEKTFFQGETAFASKDYSDALGYYIRAHDDAKKTNDKNIITKSLEGMLASLGQDSLNLKVAEKYYEPVYTRYLDNDPKSKRASSIWVKLFNTHYDAGKMPAAEKTVESFAKNFQGDYETQEGMLAKIMEYYRKKKDYSKVKYYVSAINDGKFKVSKKYADALRSLMTKIQIEGVQQSLEKGDKAVALKGYHQIYESADSTPKAKINAAYNLSALYYEMGEPNQSYQWSSTAIKDMETAEVVKFADSFLGISAGLFLRQHFEQSSDLSYRLLTKLCKENSSNKLVAYKNAVFIALANGNLDKAIEVKDSGKGCSIPDATITEVSLELLKDLSRAKRWETYEKEISELEKNSKNYPQLIRPYEDLRVVFASLGDAAQAKEVEDKQIRFFNLARSQKLDIPVEALDLISSRILARVTEKKQKLDSIQLRFPETEFNNAVKTKLQLLDQLTTEVNGIQKIGSGKGIVEAYKQVINAYEEFGTSLKAFVPEGKSPEYISSFSKAMSEVYNLILGNAKKQRGEIKKLILENKVLSESNYAVLYSSIESFKRFIPVKETVLMDRGGRK